MKSYEVQYVKGHLIDQKTGKRIFLKRGGRFNILGDDDQFEEKDELHMEEMPLDTKNKKEKLEKDHKGYMLYKIADAGIKLVYKIGLSKKTSEDISREFLFDAILMEDLYLKSKDGKEWSLCGCKCITANCIEGEVQMIEPIPGESLSNLFGNVVTFYFAFQRSTACNAFNTFFFAESDFHRLYEVKNNYLKSLDTVRQDCINEYQSSVDYSKFNNYRHVFQSKT